MWDFGRDRCVIVVARVSCEGLLVCGVLQLCAIGEKNCVRRNKNHENYPCLLDRQG